MAEDDIGADLRQAPPDQKREQLIGYLADVMLVSKAALEKNLQNGDDFKRRQAFMRNKLLMGAMLAQQAKTAINDQAMHEVYDNAVKPMAGQEEVHARHILVESEDEAKAIAEQIKGGADFATLAKEKSKDTAAEGGDLGFFTKEQMVPEFSEVAFKMYPGQVSNPVKSQFGWHIIKLEERRQRPVPPFDAVKDQIEAYLGRKSQQEFVAGLRQKAKIERTDAPAGVPQGIPPAILQQLQQMQQQQQGGQPQSETAPTPPAPAPAAPAEGATPK
jgi:peptidyl-prolyl cis-trans isomerase C